MDFLALSERGGALSAVGPASHQTRLYFTQTSELCLFLCNRTQREKVIADMRSYIYI